jgi:serine protease Do
MTFRKPVILALALAAGLSACERPAAPTPAPAPKTSGPVTPPALSGGGAPDSFAPIIRVVSPAVVSIDTLSVGGDVGGWMQDLRSGAMVAPVQRGAGSGFLISADGYVVTNNHVVQGAQEIVVTLNDGRQFPARLIGRDPPTDLSVLKIDAADLPYVSFARSALPEVGDWVVAVGNPFGLGGTATAGIVSARGREIGEAYVSYLQIDAPINSGNSGGPSFDLQGRVVGVNTAIFSPSGGSVGIGFAIPADLAETVTKQLIANGRVVRGYLGVGVGDLNPALAARLGVRGKRGAVIGEVAAGGPAAGRLRAGDVVTSVNGTAVTTAGGMMRAVAGAAPGADLVLGVLRQGRETEVRVRVGQRPDEAR